MMPDKLNRVILTIIMLLIVFLIIFLVPLYKDIQRLRKGVPIEDNMIWNQDSTRYFVVTVYTLGVFGGEYTTVSLNNGKQRLKYKERAFIGGEWISLNKVRLESYRFPSEINRKSGELAIELIIESRNSVSIDTFQFEGTSYKPN